MENSDLELVENIHTFSKIPILPTRNRLIEDHSRLYEIVQKLRQKGLVIVYTMGTWDMFHIGHDRYFCRGKESGDILIVGVDGDEYIKSTKGPDRPTVPYEERWEMVAGQRTVDIVTILQTQAANMQLVELIRPDVVVLSFSSAKEDLDEYTTQMNTKYGPYCREVKILPRQAETSTSAKIRQVVINGSKPLRKIIKEHIDKLVDGVEGFFKQMEGGES